MDAHTLLRANQSIARIRTNRLIEAIDEDRWLEMPAGIGTNVEWLVGHIITYRYFLEVESVTGPSRALESDLKIADMRASFGRTTSPSDLKAGGPRKAEMLARGELLDDAFETMLDEHATDEFLSAEPAVPNPIAKTRLGSLLFCSQHQMWHNGQLATLKRMLESSES